MTASASATRLDRDEVVIAPQEAERVIDRMVQSRPDKVKAVDRFIRGIFRARTFPRGRTFPAIRKGELRFAGVHHCLGTSRGPDDGALERPHGRVPAFVHPVDRPPRESQELNARRGAEFGVPGIWISQWMIRANLEHPKRIH